MIAFYIVIIDIIHERISGYRHMYNSFSVVSRSLSISIIKERPTANKAGGNIYLLIILCIRVEGCRSLFDSREISLGLLRGDEGRC